MTIRRAMALNAVFERCTLAHEPGELLVGAGLSGTRVKQGDYTEDEFAVAGTVLAPIGERNFHSHANHHSQDYPTVLRLGFCGLEQLSQERLAAAQNDTGRDFMQSVIVALQGARAHLRRWSAHLLALSEKEAAYSSLLSAQSEQLARLADQPPQSFRDALQLVYLCHCMMQLDNRGAQAFGRLDQFLYPFYAADRLAERISVEEAQNMLDHLFAKITAPDDFYGLGNVQNITLGGVKPEDGSDATNELSYLILEACKRVGKPGGNCTARIGDKTPRAFIEKCAQVIHTGVGYPAVFNDDLQIRCMLDLGYPIEHARDYCFVGCIEIQVQGRHAPWADSRINPLHAVSLALYNGVDTVTKQKSDLSYADDPQDFEAFYQRFLAYSQRHIRAALDIADEQQRQCDDRPAFFTAPLQSALTADCVRRGKDINDGGAVYPGDFGFGCMGISSIADSLMAVKHFVYDRRVFTLAELRAMCAANFVGYEPQRQRLLREAPKFGNNNSAVDGLAERVVRDLAAEFRARRTPGGGWYHMLMAANTSNVWAGEQIGATPDGRLAGTPVSDASSPAFGRDQNGPTAVIQSLGKIPYDLCPAGNVVNMKLSPSGGDERLWNDGLTALIQSAMRMGVSELQFNTTGAAILKKALDAPEEYESLVVRVSGFSANYVKQPRAVQEDIIARTEHNFSA